MSTVVALGIGIFSLEQKRKADNQAEWWRRAQWAIDNAVGSSSDASEAGLLAMAILLESDLASAHDRDMLADIADVVYRQDAPDV